MHMHEARRHGIAASPAGFDLADRRRHQLQHGVSDLMIGLPDTLRVEVEPEPAEHVVAWRLEVCRHDGRGAAIVGLDKAKSAKLPAAAASCRKPPVNESK